MDRWRHVLTEHSSQLPPWIHLYSSIGVARGLELGQDLGNLTRPGIGLYGYYAEALHAEVKPVLHWFAKVVKMRALAAGEHVGYGGTFHAQKATTAATLAVGYADGLCRSVSSQKLGGIDRGRLVLGRISMDLTVVEGSGLKEGQWFQILGASPEQGYELARQSQTIVYELLTGLSQRVPRVYSVASR